MIPCMCLVLVSENIRVQYLWLDTERYLLSFVLHVLGLAHFANNHHQKHACLVLLHKKITKAFVRWSITFLSPLRGHLLQQWLQEWPHRVISFYSSGHSRLTVASIVFSIVISKFLHCTILENFNLKWTTIQCGMDLGCCWMLYFL
jgi:hypothetical protein